MTSALMETTVLKRGVRYRVLDPTTLEVAWEKIVKFGYGAYRPAGKAFKEAAKQQEQIARQQMEAGYLSQRGEKGDDV